MGDFKYEVLNIANEWNTEQLTNYINLLEERIVDAHTLIKELKILRKKKLSKKVYDTGPRGGL